MGMPLWLAIFSSKCSERRYGFGMLHFVGVMQMERFSREIIGYRRESREEVGREREECDTALSNGLWSFGGYARIREA